MLGKSPSAVGPINSTSMITATWGLRKLNITGALDILLYVHSRKEKIFNLVELSILNENGFALLKYLNKFITTKKSNFHTYGMKIFQLSISMSTNSNHNLIVFIKSNIVSFHLQTMREQKLA